MQTMKHILQSKTAVIVYLSLFSVLFALVMGLFGLKVPLRVGWIFIALNFLISYFIGYWVKKQRLNIFWLLFWPVVFSVTVLIRYADYNYFFGLIYLVLSVLGYNHHNNYR
ncbi:MULTISPECIES: hypothetical protein [Amylolactobacillus]|uniref:Integral membrane protein n=1 Tax=Amylolactobacillus amylophilus DSM 20533 = JCM 1125 TaxID=1423721 RepID=A0A1L6XA38_9LACO|nr:MULTISPECIES: hypothetical protein [Amylolactobacillus]APT17841.1 hypothetical protein LA20533_00205 [Amylolactobacillus amylophilus DSM 20533 = JCM 1125]GED79761.1 hypothetical protein LAM01_02340 [Amylolactobacillus amylophilus]